VKAEDVVIQLYTSGTTGLPKGVMLTHANLVVNANTNLQIWGGWTERETILVNMPLFHIAGSGVGMLTFFLGARAVIMPDVDPGEILDLIQNERITRLFFVPAIILMLAQHPKTPKTDLTSLKTLLYGASPIPTELLVQALRIFSGTEFIQVYGMTETTGAVTALPGADHVPGSKRILSCGKVYPGSSLRIVDTEGRETKTGEVGQILVHSPQNMLGYWAKPEETAKTLREGWVYTGDAGYLDEEGYLYIHDRVKDMIISGGENIYPAEVESALYGHPAIADVAAIGVPSEKWGEEVKAVVVLKPGAKASEAEIIAFARERIAGYKLPKSVAFVDNLPRNPSGKLLKRLIREPYWQGKTRRVN
ncbi:MAG: AMP-binding protein, partial [Alphaproteobacteria bacterium]|nr:AMP-binding protein [Alphaproteobacteria bacterium]